MKGPSTYQRLIGQKGSGWALKIARIALYWLPMVSAVAFAFASVVVVVAFAVAVAVAVVRPGDEETSNSFCGICRHIDTFE